MTEKELRCKHCDRFLGMAYGDCIATIKCSNSRCKGETNFKFVTGDVSKMLHFEFPAEAKPPKEKAVSTSA